MTTKFEVCSFGQKHSSYSSTVHKSPLTTKYTLNHSNDLENPLSSVRGACSQKPAPTVTLASPQAQIEGKSQSQWQDTWWKLASAIPKSKNPLLSENAFPKLGSVQFLAGVGGGGSAKRSLTVSTGTYLFAPLINQSVDEIGFDPNWSFKDSLITAKGIMDAVDPKSLFFNSVTKKGTEIPLAKNWKEYQQSSDAPFCFTTGPDNFADYPAGTKVTRAAASGYWAMLNPLPPGEYTFHFGATIDYSKVTVPKDNSLAAQLLKTVKDGGGSSSQDITYHITVKPRSAFCPAQVHVQ